MTLFATQFTLLWLLYRSKHFLSGKLFGQELEHLAH